MRADSALGPTDKTRLTFSTHGFSFHFPFNGGCFAPLEDCVKFCMWERSAMNFALIFLWLQQNTINECQKVMWRWWSKNMCHCSTEWCSFHSSVIEHTNQQLIMSPLWLSFAIQSMNEGQKKWQHFHLHQKQCDVDIQFNCLGPVQLLMSNVNFDQI